MWHHPEADKLFCEEIDVGEEGGPRQIASGLRDHYTLEEMQDRKVLVVCNLKAAKIVGFSSNGMVLAAKVSSLCRLGVITCTHLLIIWLLRYSLLILRQTTCLTERRWQTSRNCLSSCWCTGWRTCLHRWAKRRALVFNSDKKEEGLGDGVKGIKDWREWNCYMGWQGDQDKRGCLLRC